MLTLTKPIAAGHQDRRRESGSALGPQNESKSSGPHSRLFRLTSAKLGRCPRCMRTVRNGTVLTWTAAAILYWLWPKSFVSILSLVVAASFTLLLLGHGAALTFRGVAELRRLRRARAALQSGRPMSPQRRRSLQLLLQGVTAGTLAIVMDLKEAVPAAAQTLLQIPECECYFDENCFDTGRGIFCDTSAGSINPLECATRPKPDIRIDGVLICGEDIGQPMCDGVCVNTLRFGASWKKADPTLVAQCTDLYFRAYLESGRKLAGGPPGPGLLSQALAVPLSNAWHLELQNAVRNVLDRMLGFDFSLLRGEDLFGQIPHLSDTAAELVDVAREAFVTGLEENNPQAVVQPIMDFWEQGKAFAPLHTGRCYSHGHPDFAGTPACQSRSLQLLLEHLLSGRN